MGTSNQRMKLITVVPVLLVACAATAQELEVEIDIARPGGAHRHIEAKVVRFDTLSRAPFPQPKRVPLVRIAVIQMMVNCKSEAFAKCGALPNKPICPMKLHQCLKGLDHTTPQCHKALQFLASLRGSTAAKTHLQQAQHDHHSHHGHGHSHLSCKFKHFIRRLRHAPFWFGLLFSFSCLLFGTALGMLLWRLCCKARQDRQREEAREEQELALALELSAAEAMNKRSPQHMEIHLGTPVVQVVNCQV